jgi:hypothetical protein
MAVASTNTTFQAH